MSTNQETVPIQEDVQTELHVVEVVVDTSSANESDSDSEPAIAQKSAKDSVDEDPQSGLLEPHSVNEYQNITDEERGSSTKSNNDQNDQADAADVISPESVPVAGVPVGVPSPTHRVTPSDNNVNGEDDEDDNPAVTLEIPEIEDRPSKIQRKESEYISHILECCDNGDGLDYYQLMAFHSNTKDNFKDRIKYLIYIIKASITAITQILGMIIIMIDFVVIGLDSRKGDMCREPVYAGMEWHEVLYESQLKILAFLFSTFLAFFCFDRLTGVEQGMYRKMKYAQNLKFLNIVWLRIGFSVNVIASILAVYGSFMVVFFSDNS